MGEIIASIAAAVAMIATFPSAIAGSTGLASAWGAQGAMRAQADHAKKVEKWRREAKEKAANFR